MSSGEQQKQGMFYHSLTSNFCTISALISSYFPVLSCITTTSSVDSDLFPCHLLILKFKKIFSSFRFKDNTEVHIEVEEAKYFLVLFQF